MKNITPETTVGEIVRVIPARSRVFENLHIDYCCGGKQSLADACRGKGLDAATVIAMLSALDDLPESVEADLDTMTLTELCDHIERVHHGYLREELPRLDFLTRKVAAVHGDREPRLLEVLRVFESFNEKISVHTTEEDEQVFPAIRRLEAGEGDRAASIATLKTEFDKLETEHEKTGAALARLRELTDGFTPPEWACNTFRALYDGLHRMERDMHQHVHKENSVLFPRALAL
jgi:regulator of cell morphogenesis and NO signaling